MTERKPIIHVDKQYRGNRMVISVFIHHACNEITAREVNVEAIVFTGFDVRNVENKNVFVADIRRLSK